MKTHSITDSRAGDTARLHSEAEDWLILLTSGRATAADARTLRQWCAQSPEHALAFERVKSMWQALKPATLQLQHPPRSRHFGRRAFLGGAIAACATFLLVRETVPGGFSGLAADYVTDVGEQRRIDLGEALRLELNTQTRINRLPSVAGSPRLELLSGEVEVLAQARESVGIQVGSGWLHAEHARFNLRHIDRSVCVTCLEGALTVQVQGRSVRLESARQLTFDTERTGEPQTVDPSAVIAWRSKMLVFNDAPLSAVIDEINRYRPGLLVLLNAELGKRKVQARFSLDQLARVALLIRDAYGAKCTELPGGVVLLS